MLLYSEYLEIIVDITDVFEQVAEGGWWDCVEGVEEVSAVGGG